MEYHHLKEYGLTDYFIRQADCYDGLYLARVSEQHREMYQVISEQGELQASVSGKLAYQASGCEDFPAVGDWVMIDRDDDRSGRAVIHHILKRQSVFVRKAAGTANTLQIIAANIDQVFLCMSLNADFNLRRLERYLAIAWDSGSTPVVVLTKTDLCADLSQKLAEIATVCVGCDVITCSSLEDYGYEQVVSYLTKGKTIALLGSSGVGKSTLINRLMNSEILATHETRKDDKGRHTTTHRQLMLLPQGTIVIDTPGMRELHLSSADLSRSFDDIADLATGCKFPDCSHTAEPGCAVREAIAAGELPQERFENYLKLQKELDYEGLNFRQREQEKIKRMFGSKGEMKQLMQHVKNKRHYTNNRQ
ncbi:ribosome small subunit-dependent GTPase A [Dehalobacter sp. DCM]|uniref:ribosome small subunit-dependent GTPase A n=1 Tax=Dehalobacter sp. DCM TaxID=2907827 RepID=UPI003081295C|nr:ribosome small subunit-dependent GTPase A [Dehalobacter sp. DCM]